MSAEKRDCGHRKGKEWTFMVNFINSVIFFYNVENGSKIKQRSARFVFVSSRFTGTYGALAAWTLYI